MSGCGFQLLFFGLITNCWVPFYYLSLPRVESLSRSRRGRFSSSFFCVFADAVVVVVVVAVVCVFIRK